MFGDERFQNITTPRLEGRNGWIEIRACLSGVA
jgi:hypothetical protein